MKTITQHIPAFIDLGETPKVREYENIVELFKVDFVDEYTRHLDFDGFVVNDSLLMAKYKDGLKVVIGYIKKDG